MLSCRALARGGLALRRRAARCASFAAQPLPQRAPLSPLRRLPGGLAPPTRAVPRSLPLAAARLHQVATAAAPERVQAAADVPAATPTLVTAPEPTFASLGVAQPLVTYLKSQGLTRPTRIQAAAVPALLSGKNAAVQGQTGSGKTLAYLLPLLTSCFETEAAALSGTGKRTSDHVLGIVVAPSQELAMQIVRQAEALLGPAGRQYVAQAIGGANMRRQLDALRRNKPMLVVGTPGRLAELSLLGHLKTHHVRCLVLDEADELLDGVFARHLARLEEHAGRAVFAGRQTVLVSATLTPRTLSAYAPWCAAPQVVTFAGVAGAGAAAAQPNTPAEVAAGGSEAAPASVYNEPPPSLPEQLLHNYVLVGDIRHRVDLLRKSIHALDSQRALVFLNFGRRLADTAEKLRSRGMAVGALHGGLTKTERAATLAAFRAGKLRALLVTDLAARGLDVPECDAVFNLELPSDGVHYAHRAGRTARAGRAGRMVTLVEPRQTFVLRKFEKSLGVAIAEAKVFAGEMTPAGQAAPEAADAAAPAARAAPQAAA